MYVLDEKKKIRHTPANPSFFYIKVASKGVYISRTCFRDIKQYSCRFSSFKCIHIAMNCNLNI